MKRLFYSMLALAISAMTFTSCEDVPAPYAYPEAQGDGVYLNTSFANSLSPWTSYVTEGEDGLHWKNAYSSAVCTGSWVPEGATDNKRVNHAGRAWLVSPEIDLSGATQVRISFDHAIAYERTSDIHLHHKLMFSSNYVEGSDPSTAEWQQIDFDFGKADHSGGNYNFEQTGANLTPEMFVKNARFAFVYTSTTDNASTWEVKNFLCMEGVYEAQGGEEESSSEFTKTNGVISGQTYAIAAQAQVQAYEIAKALDGTKTYGYLSKETFMIEDDPNVIRVSDDAKFVFTAVDGGYTIQDKDGKYYFMKGTYNSFNRSDDMSDPEGCYVWTISFNEDGTANIVNKDKQKTIFFDGQYGSYGAYSEGANTRFPTYLFTNGETGGDQGEGGGGGGDDQPTDDKGTAENPYTVAEAIDVINGLADGATTDKEVYVKGLTVADGSSWYFNSQYGQCNYYISDDGTETNTIYVYNGKDLNNANFTAAPSYAKGSEIVIFGKLQKYVKDGKVTPELARGNYIYSIKEGQGGGGDEPSTGHGMSADDPYTVAEALEIINGLSDGGYSETEVYVKGKISSDFQYYSNYKNCNYYISDTGSRDNELYIYAGNDLNNAPFEAAPNYQVGYTVVIYGKLQKYVKNGNVTPEMAKGNYIVSIDETVTPSDPDPDDPNPDDPTGGDTGTVTKTVDEDNVTVTYTLEGAVENGDEIFDLTTCGLEHQTENPSFELNGTSFAFAQGDGSVTPKYWCTGNYNEFRMYAKNTVTITAKKEVAKVVLTCTSYQTTKYVGNPQSYATIEGNKVVIMNDWTAAASGTQLRFTSVHLYYK